MTEEEAKAILRSDVPVNIRKELEAIDKAIEVLGEDSTMSDVWKWCNEEKAVAAGDI